MVWQSRSREVSFGEAWLGSLGEVCLGRVTNVVVGQKRQGLYSRGMVWCGKAVMVLSGVDG
jgi:hypothetical protein